MIEFGVNLKRFEVPASFGGICRENDPILWITESIDRTLSLNLGNSSDYRLRFFLPESLLYPALQAMSEFPKEKRRNFSIGAQTVFRENISSLGNFGAFTANLPAAGIKAIGSCTALIGHSEERADKFSQFLYYDPKISDFGEAFLRAAQSVNQLVGREVVTALDAGLSVMFCVGETAEERGEGTDDEKFSRSASVIARQLEPALHNLSETADIVIAYEPRWAIGPGRTPPDADYTESISNSIKHETRKLCGRELPVLYGGGLKRENGAAIGKIPSNDGGLVALTRFTEPIGFDPDELKVIIDLYFEGKRSII